MKVSVQRVNEYQPIKSSTVILVDRLWPRGVSKASLQNVEWIKDLAPSNELRHWFHEDIASRYKTFTKKYAIELANKESVLEEQLKKLKEPVILLTAVRELEMSHIPTLVSFLKKF